MALPEDADAEEQLQELEALGSIFGEDLTVLNESPIELEIIVPLELGGARDLHVRVVPVDGISPGSGNSTVPSTADISLASSDDVRPCAVVSQENPQQEKETSVPEAIKYAEHVLEKRGSFSVMDSLESGPGGLLVKVSYLPPLRLVVKFGDRYPSSEPPDFRLISAWMSCKQLETLCANLDDIGSEMLGCPIVFAWADWLQNSAMEHLGLDGGAPMIISQTISSDIRAISELERTPEEVVQALCTYDLDHGWWTWQQTAHLCMICFTEKPGTAFAKIGSCAHTFCLECIAEMARVHITEGTVVSIRCPLPDCRGEVAPGILRELVSDAHYERWHRLQIQKILSEIQGLTYCPRCESNGYETPALPPEEPDDPNVPPLVICDRCDYSYCAACRDAYHPNSRCMAQIHRLERLGLQSNLSQSADKTKKQRLAEELESLRFILAGTTPCPKCKMPVSRTQGCNHMICANCSTHFCYRCGADITEAGYGHFRADKCPTFDRDEVERLRGNVDGVGEDALEAELEELRRQYPEQAGMVWNFRPPPGAWRRAARRRQQADVPCPTCRQWNGRAGTNNHVRCRVCRTNFCFACKKAIKGTITDHFRGPGACAQHSAE